jgi:hypothetical protein
MALGQSDFMHRKTSPSFLFVVIILGWIATTVMGAAAARMCIPG